MASGWQGATHLRIYGRGLVSKQAFSLKKSRRGGGGYRRRLHCGMLCRIHGVQIQPAKHNMLPRYIVQIVRLAHGNKIYILQAMQIIIYVSEGSMCPDRSPSRS